MCFSVFICFIILIKGLLSRGYQLFIAVNVVLVERSAKPYLSSIEHIQNTYKRTCTLYIGKLRICSLVKAHSTASSVDSQSNTRLTVSSSVCANIVCGVYLKFSLFPAFSHLI